MKVKKIVLAMISTLILLAMSFGQSVYASKIIEEEELPVKLVTNLSDEKQYAIGIPSNTNGTNSVKINTIGILGSGNKVDRIYDAYCAWANRGFNDTYSRPVDVYESNETADIDTYRQRYNMKEEVKKEYITTNQILQDFTINGKSSYDAILQLADLFYTEEDDFDLYRNTTLQRAINSYDNIGDKEYDEYDEEDLLNEDEVRCIQQLAVWYFSNYDDPIDNGGLSHFSDLLDLIDDWTYKVGNTYVSVDTATTRSDKRDQAKCLFKYLTETALANIGRETFSDVYVYTNENQGSTSIQNTQSVIIIRKQNKYFDLALRKYISSVTAPSGKTTEYTANGERKPNVDAEDLASNDDTTATYKHRKDPITVVSGSTVRYRLVIYNEGEVDGRATKVIDQLPSGVEFKRVISGNFKSDGTYNTTNNKLTLIRDSQGENYNKDLPAYSRGTGETAAEPASEVIELECIVTAQPDKNKEKIYTNIAWIAEDYNERGIADRDSNNETATNEGRTTPDLPDEFVTDLPNVGYTGKENLTTEQQLANKDKYYKGQEDDDDFEKIKIIPGPEIHKGVETVENQDTGYELYTRDQLNQIKFKQHLWVINSSIPENIADYEKYIITDDIDSRLVFSGVDTIKVSIIGEDGLDIVQLVKDQDYKVIYTSYDTPTDSELLGNNLKCSGTFKIIFINNVDGVTDAEKMETVSSKLTSNTGKKIKVTYNTTFKLKSDGTMLAELGTNIPNKARLDYGNGNTIETETPEIHTGGVSLYKYEMTTEEGEKVKVALPGAKFQIFDNIDDANTWFDTDDTNNATGIAEETSDGDGLVTFAGLKYGGNASDDESNKLNDGTYVQGKIDDDTPKDYINRAKRVGTQYWIVETEVPEGYRSTLEGPISVIIDEDSHNITIATAEDVDLEEDDNSGRAVENKPKAVDFALRKFITKINDSNKEADGTDIDRVPKIPGNSIEGEKTTAEKDHTKDPLVVKKGDKVLYTIRVYNEGEIAGKVSEITDYLPAGLDYITEGTEEGQSKINLDNGWDYDTETRKVTTDLLKDEVITPVEGKWSKLDDKENGNPIYYRDVQIECTVNSNATSKTLRNVAEITELTDTEGNTIPKDADSTPDRLTDTQKENPKTETSTEGKGWEDDDDFEDLKLNFDLALRKYITKVERVGENDEVTEITIASREPQIDETTINSKEEGEYPTTATYKHRKDPVLVQNGDYIYYTLTVYNEGDVNGNATQIIDQLPAHLEFDETDTTSIVSDIFELDNYDSDSHIITFKRKDDQPIQQAYSPTHLAEYSESITIKCKLNYDEEESKIFTNIAWISEYYSEDEGKVVPEDRDSESQTHPEGEELETTGVGYTGYDKNENKNPYKNESELNNSNKYYRGQEDDDDFEKIKIVNGPDIHKGVKTVENQDSGYNKDEQHTWVIHSTIPEDIEDYTKYVISDNIDYRLKYVPNSVVVYKGGESVPEEDPMALEWTLNNKLVEGEDYILTYTPYSNNAEYSGNITLTFIDTENGKNATDKFKSFKGGFIVVTFETKFAVDEDGNMLAELGTNIPNQAELQYNNGSGEQTKKTETPEVHTGGVSLFKYYDKNGHKISLAGAKFQIFDNEADAKKWFDDTVTNKPQGIAEVVSDGNGLVTFTGLKYGGDAKDDESNYSDIDGTYVQNRDNGKVKEPEKRVIPGTTYWIVETEVPSGYKSTITKPIQVVIDKDSHLIEIETQEQKDEVEDVNTNNEDNSGKAVENIPEEIDLALRKFITRVGAEFPMTEDNSTKYVRQPHDTSKDNDVSDEDVKKLYNGEIETANYKHTKDPVKVNVGDYVEYTLRVYNEGSMDAYALEITDYLPKYLKFVECDENTAYGWQVDQKDSRKITTNYLNSTKLSAVTATKLDSSKAHNKELKIICQVEKDVPYNEYQTNIAQISLYGDKNKKELTADRDSQTVDKGYVKVDDKDLPSYKGDKNNKDDLSDSEYYYKGIQDDDDFEKIYVDKFDLALRKFITKVEAGTEHNKGQDRYTQADYEARVPKVSGLEEFIKGDTTTLDYSHSKEPMMTALNDEVTYTLRIYNEGQVDGYAEVITDDIPDGVEFIPASENATNKEYGWRMYKEIKTRAEANGAKVVECKVKEDEEVRLFVETENAKEATIIRTDYLSMKNGKEKMKEGDTENPNLIKAFNPDAALSDKNPDYRDIKVVFRVKEPYGSDRIITNYAQISEDKGGNGQEVEDRDSKTDLWNKGEDDQDVEHIRVPDFDLALRKWVTQSIVIENGETVVQETGHDAWDDPEEPAKVELHRRKLSNVTVKFRFSIRVYNESEIDGYVKQIKDHIPQGLKFLPEDNPDWVDEGNNVITTRKLENTLLKPGQYTDVEVLLTWINGADNLGLKTNYAEISEDFNDWGAPDNDSTPNNMKERHEDDDDEAPVILSVSTGIEESYIILTLVVLTTLAGGIALIKKYVM